MDPNGLEEDKRQCLKQLRERLGGSIPPSHDDRYLLKWLVARKFEVAKAESMYRKSQKWRADNRVDSLLRTYQPPEVLKKYYPGGVFGEDREGRPVVIDPIGRIDLKGILGSVRKRDVIKHTIHMSERLKELFITQSKKHGRPIDQCTQIIDIEGFGSNFIWRPALDFYMEMLAVLSDNYPDILKRTFIINAPSLFRAAYSLVKSFIDEGTSSKFVLLDGKWHAEVFKYIDPSELPEYYGGVHRDVNGDPNCSSVIGYGGPVPDQYYINRGPIFPDSAVVTQVGRRGEVKVKIEVKEKTEVLKWIFGTESGDMEFSLWRNEPGPAVRLIDKKVQCDSVPEDDVYVCEGPGLYSVVFRNPSMLSSRKLTYFTERVRSEDYDTAHENDEDSSSYL